MKTNDIVDNRLDEGPVDFLRRQKAGISAYRASTADAKALSNIENDFATRQARDKSNAMKAWQNHFAQIPNKIAVSQNPNAYFKELNNFLTQRYKKAPEIELPNAIDNTNVQSVINQFSNNYYVDKKQAAINALQPKTAKPVAVDEPANEPAATPAPVAAPAATPTAPGTKVDWTANQTWRNKTQGKLPPGIHTITKPAAPKVTAPAPTTTTAAPKVTAPAPTTTTAAPKVTAPAPTTTTAAPKTAAPDVAITLDQIKNNLDGLSAAEQRKMLSQLLKNPNLKVSAAR